MHARIPLTGLAVVALAVLVPVDTPAPTSLDPHSAWTAGVQAQALPLAFERNDGQHPAAARFVARGAGYTFRLDNDALHVSLRGEAHARFAMRFAGGRAGTVTAELPLASRANYFTKSTARTDIPTFARVRYEDVWPGIDTVFYGNGRQLEYDVVVGPGADAASARFTLEGAEQVQIDAKGQLALRVAGRDVTYSPPVAYQVVDGARRSVDAEYTLAGNTLSFEVGGYDHMQPLVIDPVLYYSTYVGGKDVDTIADAATDGAGNVYVIGETASLDFEGFRVPWGPWQEPALDGHVFVAKFTPQGSLDWASYFVTTGSTLAGGIAVDSSSNVYITGRTTASDFPTKNAYDAEYNPGGYNPYDAYLLKLAARGDNIVYSTYIGGDDEDGGTDLAVTVAGEAIVVGHTISTNFPVTNGTTRTTYMPYWDDPPYDDGFAMKFNRTGSGPVDSTFLYGGAANGVAIDAAGRAYIVGHAWQESLPTSSSAVQPEYGGGDSDGYFMRLDPDLNLEHVTYLGGSDQDRLEAVGVNHLGTAFVAGWSYGFGFPTTADALQPLNTGQSDAVFAQIGNAGDLQYSTLFGGPGEDIAEAVDFQWSFMPFGQQRDTVTTIAGRTGGGLPVTDAVQPSYGGGGSDAFVAAFVGPSVQYVTYLGGANHDMATALTVHTTGRTTTAGLTHSGNFPLQAPDDSVHSCEEACGEGFLTQFVERDPGTLSDGAIVIHPATDPTLFTSGAWRVTSDATAAGGARLEHPDAGAAKVATPSSAPTDYFEVTTAVAGTNPSGPSYQVWIRGKAERNSFNNDSVYVQFSNAFDDNEIGRQPLWAIGSTEALTVTLEDCIGCGLQEWAWQDGTFGFKVPPSEMIEMFDGVQTTIRVQTREDGISIDQILLIPNVDVPGFQKSDTTIYPAQDGEGGGGNLATSLSTPEWTILRSMAAGASRRTAPPPAG